jgi:hypothetical protein
MMPFRAQLLRDEVIKPQPFISYGCRDIELKMRWWQIFTPSSNMMVEYLMRVASDHHIVDITVSVGFGRPIR